MQGRQLELGVPRTNEEDLRRMSRSEGWDARFPEDVYEHIEEFWEETASREDAAGRRKSE